MHVFCSFKDSWDEHFFVIDFLISLAVALGFFYWLEYHDGMQVVCPLLFENRAAIYGTLTSTFGSILGFVITSFSIIIGYLSSPRFDFFKRTRHVDTLSALWLQTISVLGLSTIFSLIGLVLDRDAHQVFLILYVLLFLTVFSAFRIYSCLKVLGLLVVGMSKEIPNASEIEVDLDLQEAD